VLVALASFALGLLASTREAPDPGAPELPPRGSLDAGAPKPRILFDPATIQLLPDASLRLDLPDAGSADGSGPR
jgi:hypothetical protein